VRRRIQHRVKVRELLCEIRRVAVRGVEGHREHVVDEVAARVFVNGISDIIGAAPLLAAAADGSVDRRGAAPS
jgi:hypothetical protein